MSNSDHIIVVKDLHKYCGSIKAVDGVNLNIEQGKVVVVIGRPQRLWKIYLAALY